MPLIFSRQLVLFKQQYRTLCCRTNVADKLSMQRSELKTIAQLIKRSLESRGWVKISDVDRLKHAVSRGYALPRMEILPREHVIERVVKYGRLALPELAPANSPALELGVAAGYFSEAILQNKNIPRLFSVDCWMDHHDSNEYLTACARLSKYGTRSIVIRSYFDDVLDLFPDEFFGFIYIDAYAHTGQENGLLLHAWYPKLRKGGIFSGHDYDHDAWPETVKAVNEFSKIIGKEVTVVPGINTSNPQDLYPSWYVVK